MDIRSIKERTEVFETDLSLGSSYWIAGQPERIFAQKIDNETFEPSFTTSSEQTGQFKGFTEAECCSEAVVGYFFPELNASYTEYGFLNNRPASENPAAIVESALSQRLGYSYEPPHLKVLTQDSLPTELFNHQLLACDCECEESVFDFLSEWGFPFTPLRSAKGVTPGQEWVCSHEQTIGIGQTHWLEELFMPHDKFNDDVEDKTLPTGYVISFVEAKEAINLLKAISASVTDYVRDGKTPPLMFLIEACIRSPYHFRLAVPYDKMYSYGDELTERGFLTQAICNQIYESVGDPAPWRACACEGCNVIFKRKQSKSNNPDSDSVYCCDKCAERQKKRNQRAAARNRIQH